MSFSIRRSRRPKTPAIQRCTPCYKGSWRSTRSASPTSNMIRIDDSLTPAELLPAIARLWDLSAARILAIEQTWAPGSGAPVFTVAGRYTAKGWTEWTQGFQFGAAILQYDATGDARFLDLG